MHKAHICLLTVCLWTPSMFIKLNETKVRGQIIRTYVYTFYQGVAAFTREPLRFFTEQDTFGVAIFFLVIVLAHIGLCLLLACVCVWSFLPPPTQRLLPNHALQRTAAGGEAASDHHA